MASQASVLFFDEATSALDNKSEKAIQATIDNIANKAGGCGAQRTNLTVVTRACAHKCHKEMRKMGPQRTQAYGRKANSYGGERNTGPQLFMVSRRKLA
eukprot:243286-Amphidinium_carterae.1